METPTILVVDDDPVTLLALKSHFERLKLNTHLARNGLEANLAIARQPYQIVILDIKMPFMNGFEVVQSIRRTWGSLCYTVAITGSLENLDAEECRSCGFDRFYRKPITPGMIQEIVEQWRSTLSACEPSADARPAKP